MHAMLPILIFYNTVNTVVELFSRVGFKNKTQQALDGSTAPAATKLTAHCWTKLFLSYKSEFLIVLCVSLN